MTILSFDGRLSRSQYLITLLVILSVGVLIHLIDYDTPDPILYWSSLGLCALFSLAAGAKRFRDAGQSGWLCLMLLVPIVSLLVMVALVFLPAVQPDA